jgi:hypothetical protein
MSNPEPSLSSLPEPWVRKIFATMRATYGAAFDRQWQCPAGVEPVEHAAEMVEHWGRELRGYQQSPKAIAHALDNLPPNVPNLIEFKALCRQAPQYVENPRLPAPKPNMEVAAEALKGVNVQADDPKAWAHRLREREMRSKGAGMTMAQKRMWREALGENREAS